MENSSLRAQVIETGRKLVRYGLTARSWGNISCRKGSDAFLVTASGRNYMTMSPDEVIEVNLDDLEYIGDIKPSSEMRSHREIYDLYPEAGAIIHTHQSNASAVSALGVSRVRLTKKCPGIGYELICADYALPGTEELASNVAEAFRKTDGRAVIMKNHGAICYGKDCEEAFATACMLEDMCGEYLYALGIKPWKMENEEIYGRENETVIWNDSEPVRRFSSKAAVLMPYLDDFAQLIGSSLKTVNDDEKTVKDAIAAGTSMLVRGRGALCVSRSDCDAEAISMVIEKNCRAYMAASLTGNRPIKEAECIYMRNMYLNGYAALFDME